jgi:putative ABC transport system substrate-binding protein
MRRRELLIAMGAGALATPLASFAQQPAAKVRRIGRLAPATSAFTSLPDEGFRQGMRELGWSEGANFATEYRYADGVLERLPALAAELVRLKVEVIVAGSTPAIVAAKNATATIPIVMITTGDPVAGGLVASLAHPGGNVTGVTALGQELGGKALDLLKEAVPNISRVAVLGGPAYPSMGTGAQAIESAARALGVTLQTVVVRTPAEIDGAFAAMREQRAGGLLVLPDPMFNIQTSRIPELAARHRLPAIYELSEFVDAGGLMFYGAALRDMYRRAATFVDKILRGAKPGDLPIEQPTQFELDINLKAAKALGIKIPQSLLVRADRVIE